MSYATPVQIVAAGRVAYTAPGTPAFSWVDGAFGLVDTGVGVVTFTLDTGPASQTAPGLAVLVTPEGTVACITTYVVVQVASANPGVTPSTTNIVIRTFDAAGAALDDTAFSFIALVGPTTR